MDFPICILFLCYFPFSSAIECYFCTSASDARCLDVSLFPSQATSLQPVECQSHHVDETLSNVRKDIPSTDDRNYNCIKIETRNSFVNKTEVIRGCIQAASRRFDPCKHIRQNFISQSDLAYCNECKTDACNEAFTLASQNLSVLISVLAFFYVLIH